MNGRVYDPVSARFISPDPFVQAPYNTQSYNRYSYVINNPLTLIDPSGYNWLSDRWQEGWDDIKGGVSTLRSNVHFNDLADSIRGSETLNTVLSLAACHYGGPAGCAAYNAYVAKLHGADNFGALYAGAMGGFMAMSFTAVGDLGLGTATWQNALAHGAVGAFFGGMSGGGILSKDAASGFAGGFAGEYFSNYGIRGAMLAGGIGSRLSGGTFWSGARTGAYGYIFNYCMHSAQCWDEAQVTINTLLNRFTQSVSDVMSYVADNPVDMALIAASLIPGPNAATAVSLGAKGLVHIIERHTVSGALSAGKSVFNAGEDFYALAAQAGAVQPISSGRNLVRVVDAGRPIGVNRVTGQMTSTYTVVTNRAGDVVTMYPGTP